MILAALAILVAALWSLWRSQKYPSLRAWWNGEGLLAWMMVAVLVFALVGSRFFGEISARGTAGVRVAYNVAS